MRLETPPRWRRLLKDAIASAIWHARPLSASLPIGAGRSRAVVVGYHRVVDDFRSDSMVDMPTMLVSRLMFERHIDWIGRDFDFVGLDDIGDIVEGRRVPRKPVAAITFDDGYQDVYENAVPILTRKGIPAAAFVVTGHVGGSCRQIHDSLYQAMAAVYEAWDQPWPHLSRLLAAAGLGEPVLKTMRLASRNPYDAVSSLLPAVSRAQADRVADLLSAQTKPSQTAGPLAMTWDMVQSMRRAGFIIGSHTRTHAWLANEHEDAAYDEISGSRQELEERLGEPVLHFGYPGGQFTPPVVDMVARAGYRYAYTACDHRDPRYPSLTIRRLLLWQGSSLGADGDFSSAVLRCQTHGLWPPVHRCERVHAA